MTETVDLPLIKVPIVSEVDVLVIGGGPSGTAAAVCAARQGAMTMLVERYGYLGGLANGAMVIMLDDMCYAGEITVGGIVDEFMERLHKIGGLVKPRRQDLFKNNTELQKKYYWWGFLEGIGKSPFSSVEHRALFDVESSKQVLFNMICESGVKLKLHSWCVSAITSDNKVSGAIFFSKSGYYAIKSNIVIDTTGDGDVYSSSGARYVIGNYLISVPHFMINVDTEKYIRFAEEHPAEIAKLDRQIKSIYGITWTPWNRLTTIPGMVWCDAPHIRGYNALDIDDLTFIEIEGRRRIWKALEFLRKNYPGFENASIVRTSDQIGVRQSRLLVGEYVITLGDIRNHVRFPDTVGRGGGYFYPYRSFLPKEIDNLLVAGRHISLEPKAQRQAREIAPCMVTGQAVGTAAALALRRGVRVRDIDVSELQQILQEQGAIL